MRDLTRQERDNQSIIADPDVGEESEEEGNSDTTPVEGWSEDEAEGFSFPQLGHIGLPSAVKSVAMPLIHSLGEELMEAVAASEERKRQRMEEERRCQSTKAYKFSEHTMREAQQDISDNEGAQPLPDRQQPAL